LYDAVVTSNTSPNISPLPVAVIGCGRMGRLHARVYSEMPRVRLLGVYDANPEAAAAAAEQYDCRAFASLEELLAAAEAVTIAVPTAFHADVAEKCLAAGRACLVEKPLAKDVADARRIVAVAARAGVVVQVGHIERFNPAIRAMEKLDIRARFIEVTRISPLTFRSIDVGVVLDMMIHDIDIVLRLARSKVARIDAVGVSVIGDVEDICNARLTFENGCVANLTASRLALKTERRLRVFSPDAYVSLDYQKRYGIVARRGGNLNAIRDAVAKIRSGEIDDLSQLNYADLVQVEELQIDDIEPLRGQLESFVDAVTAGIAPVVTLDDGLAAVETATRIVQSMASQPL
jgi:predicted dehydrogenase